MRWLKLRKSKMYFNFFCTHFILMMLKLVLLSNFWLLALQRQVIFLYLSQGLFLFSAMILQITFWFLFIVKSLLYTSRFALIFPELLNLLYITKKRKKISEKICFHGKYIRLHFVGQCYPYCGHKIEKIQGP